MQAETTRQQLSTDYHITPRVSVLLCFEPFQFSFSPPYWFFFARQIAAMVDSESSILFHENKAAYDGMMVAALTYGEHDDTISPG